MDETRVLRRKQIKLGLAVVVLLLIGFIVFTILHRTPTQKIYLHNTGVNLPHEVVASSSDGTYLTVTNRNFVRYNPESGKTELLMSDAALPPISNLVWSPDQNRAIFSSLSDSGASGTPKLDALGVTLNGLGITTERPVWWVVDFKSKTYSVLGIDLKNAGWVDKNTAFVVGIPLNKPATGLYTTNVSSIDFKSLYQANDLLGAYRFGDDFVIYTAMKGNGILSRLVSGKPQLVASNLTRPPQLNPQATTAVVYTNTSKDVTSEDADLTEDTVRLLDTKSGKFLKTLAEKQASSGFWSSKGDVFYFFEDGTHVLVANTVSGGSASIKHIELKNKPASTIYKLLPDGRGDMLVFDTDNRAYYASPLQTRIVTPFNQYPLRSPQGVVGGGFNLYYFAENKSYAMSITDPDFDGAQKRGADALRRAGANPDLLDITYEYERDPITSGVTVNTQPIPYAAGD